MTRIASRSQATTGISVELENSRLSSVMKAWKRQAAEETRQILLDEEAERLKS